MGEVEEARVPMSPRPAQEEEEVVEGEEVGVEEVEAEVLPERAMKVRLTLWRKSRARPHLSSTYMSFSTHTHTHTQIKPTCSIYRKWWWWWWRRWGWSRHCPNNPRVGGAHSRAVARRHGARRAHGAGRRGGQDGDVSVSLLVDLDGALLLQLVDLLLQLGLPLQGLVLLLHLLPQRDHLRAGVFAHLLRTKTGSFLQNRGKVRSSRILEIIYTSLTLKVFLKKKA